MSSQSKRAVVPTVLSLILYLFVPANAAQPKAPTTATQSLSQILEQCAARSALPERYYYHLERKARYDHRDGDDGITGEEVSANVYRDGLRMDIAAKTLTIKGTSVTPDYAFRDIWDGKRFYHRQQAIAPGAHQMLVSTAGKLMLDAKYPLTTDQLLDGKDPGDDVPAALVVKQSGNAHAKGTENIDGHPCTVIEASTKCGLYRLWIDTDAGCLLRKLQIEKHIGDLDSGKPLGSGKGQSIRLLARTVTMDQVTTEAFAGHTIVTGARIVKMWRFERNKYELNTEFVRRSRFALTPDFAAKKAFIMDGIPENCPVEVTDRSPNDHLAYIWKDGAVRVDDDKLAGKLIDEVIQNEKNAKK